MLISLATQTPRKALPYRSSNSAALCAFFPLFLIQKISSKSIYRVVASDSIVVAWLSLGSASLLNYPNLAKAKSLRLSKEKREPLPRQSIPK